MLRTSLPTHALPFLAGALALAAPGCGDSSGTPIEFRIPKGFRGPIKIFAVPGAGQHKRQDGHLVVNVPQDGVLKLSDTLAFAKWHSEFVSFADGTPISIGFAHEVNKEGIALWSMSRDHEGTVFFFVGTRNERDDWEASQR